MWIFLVCGHNSLTAGKGHSHALLEALGIRQFLPTTTELHQWSDRKQVVHPPLFPGYLFVHINPSPESDAPRPRGPGNRRLCRQSQRTFTIRMGRSKTSARHSREEFHARHILFCRRATRVRVVRGALAGIEGGFVRNGAKGQLIISIEMIQRSLALTVFEEDVEPLTTAAQDDSKICRSRKSGVWLRSPSSFMASRMTL